MKHGSRAPVMTPSVSGGVKPNKNSEEQFMAVKYRQNVFLSMALNMSWQLAVVVLAPILLGVKLDKVFNAGYVYTLIGLGLAFIGSAVVMWRAMQIANRLPVPKLSAAQKRAIRKSYEEEDRDE